MTHSSLPESDFDCVAELHLTAIRQDGTAKDVHLSVHKPTPTDDEGNFACRIDGAGLQTWAGQMDIHGVGSFNALWLALRFVKDILTSEIQTGVNIMWEGELFEVDEMLPNQNKA